jgi:hypothetical protein
MRTILDRTRELIIYLKANPPHVPVKVSRSMTTVAFSTGEGTDYRVVSVTVQGPLYHLRIPLAPEQAPWPDAFIGGFADTVEEVAVMIAGFLFPELAR